MSDVTDADELGDEESRTRQRSTIAFPYTDFENSVQVARAIHDNAGRGTCSSHQLAEWLSVSHKSSGFRTALAAAKLFGLIGSDETNNFYLTKLGVKVIDPIQADSAKVESFLSVPLFNALYELYKDSVVPPSPAIERDMVSLGVAEKQKARARQLFESSAAQTGFRDRGSNRMKKPLPVSEVLSVPTSINPLASQANNSESRDEKVQMNGLDLDPLLIALLKKIPNNGEPWPAEKRLRWFRTLAMNVSQVYDDDSEPVELQIVLVDPMLG